MFIRTNERESGKSGRNIGDRGRHTSVNETDLLLVLFRKDDLGFNVTWFDQREGAADVFHEFLTFQVTKDGFSEIGVADIVLDGVHLAKIMVVYSILTIYICHWKGN